MRFTIFCFVFLFLSSAIAQTTPPPAPPPKAVGPSGQWAGGGAIPPKDALSIAEARQFAELVQMPGLEQLISDQAKTILAGEIDRKIEEWLKEEGYLVGRNNPEISRQLKEKIKARLIKWLPTQLEKIVRKELLKGETGRAIYAELNKTLNEQADRWLGGWYDRLAGKTKVDSLVAERLGDLLGKSTVRGLQKGILFGLKGEMPKEAMQYLRMGPDKFAEYVAKGKVYLPGAQFRKYRQQMMQLHIFDLPNRVYGGILAASAAMHMAKAFSGWKINPRELKRAQEVIRTMIWQLKTKKAVSMTLGDFTQLVKRLGDQLGSFHWRAFQQMAKWNPAKLFLDKLDQIEKEFGKLDQLYDKTTGKVLAGMNEGISELEKKLKELSQGLLQPMTNPISCFSGGSGIAASGILAKDCPDIFSELPDVTSWKGLKKAIGREDGLFGKWGDQTPWTKAKEFYQKSAVNKEMAEGMAKAAVKITDALHITGPLAEILKIEKVPARNVSQDSDFDPVLLHNGEFYYTATDLTLPDAGIDFQFNRIYRSRSEFLGVLGHHWTHNLAQRLLPWQSPDGFGLTYVDGEGKKWFLKEVEVGVFQPPADLAVEFQTTPEGYALTRDGLMYQFNPEGILTAIQDAEGRQLTLSYNDVGQLTAVTEPSGREIEFRYLANGLLEKLIDPTGRTWSYEYNGGQELVAVTVPGTARFPKGKTTHYAYDNHQMTLIMDPKGQVYLQNYYGKAGKDAGKILAQKYGDGKYITEARYDGLNTWVVDRRGVLHQYQHDEEGEKVPGTFLPESAWHLFAKQREEKRCSNSGVCPAEEPSCSKRCQALSYKFDSWGNIVVIQSPDGRERRLEIDANNLITKEIVDGEERFYQYDANDNIIAIEVPARQLKLEFEYDILDQLITKKEILHEVKVITTRYEYDPQGRLARLIYPLGNDIRFVHDEVGELSQIIRGEGTLEKSVQVISDSPTELPSLSWPPAFPPPQQESKEVVYDPLGRPIQIKGVAMEWDDNSRLFALTSEQGETTHYYYDSLNRLVLEKFPDGTERSYAYDSADRLTGTIQRDGTPIVYDYNSQGKLAKREAPTLRQEFYYDDEGRLIRAVDFNDLAIRADDVETAFAYDKNSRLIGEKIHGQWVYKSFDRVDQKTGITYPNGLQVVREYREGRLVNLFAEGQPIEVPGTFLQNDKNLCNSPCGADTPAEEIVPSKKVPGTFRRDPNGNLVEDDDFAYAYDSLHRLVAVQEKQTNKEIRFQYDPLGRLAGKGKTRYFYDEWNSIAAYSEDGTQRHTIYASEMDQPAAFLKGDDLYFYRLDRFGSVRQVVDPSGQIVEAYDYLPFGEMTLPKLSPIGNELGFIGRPFDFEGRLVYLRHRFYAPSHHQFLTADPLGYKNEFYAASLVQTPINFSYHQGQGGAARTSFPNYVEEEGEKVLIDFDLFAITPPPPVSVPETDLYAYAGGDPLHYYDPLGLYKVEVELPPWDADPSKNQRGKAGRLMLRDDQGWPVAGPYPVLGRSTAKGNRNGNRDPSKVNGDTPTGDYRVISFTNPENYDRFGPYSIVIDPIGGQALQAKQNGRRGLAIHGGRSNPKSPYGPGLIPTWGCLRMQNKDIVKLSESIKNLRFRGDSNGTVIVREEL